MPLQVGNVCRAEARIVSVTNADEGKIVKVKGHVHPGGQPVIELVSAFLYRGHFTDYENSSRSQRSPTMLSSWRWMQMLKFFSQRNGFHGRAGHQC